MHQTSGRCCTFTTPTKRVGDTPQEDELALFIVEQAGSLTDDENKMLALEPDVSILLQPVTQADGADLTALSLAEFISAQVVDAHSQRVVKKLGKGETETTINKKRVLVRRTHIARALQKLMPHSLRQRILALLQYFSLSSHAGQRHMYYTIRRDYFWPKVVLTCTIPSEVAKAVLRTAATQTQTSV